MTYIRRSPPPTLNHLPLAAFNIYTFSPRPPLHHTNLCFHPSLPVLPPPFLSQPWPLSCSTCEYDCIRRRRSKMELTTQWPWRYVFLQTDIASACNRRFRIGTDLHTALRVAKNYTKGYSDTQVSYRFQISPADKQTKVRDATSNDPWGPSGTQMNELAQLTYKQ